jgi:tRNA threonylcarbamoyladenosine biosynthesis protein TsaE
VDSIISREPGETLALGRREGQRGQAGDVLALCGELGTGKTQFVKGLAEGMGITTEVTSPTFTLIHEYAGGRLPLYHFDFYRLGSAAETIALGFDDYIDRDGVTVIEWADKFADLLPARTRWFRFTQTVDGARQISLPD